jgi:CheY-like chemotaxis protein
MNNGQTRRNKQKIIVKTPEERRCRILVVDDEAQACRSIRTALTHNGCRVSIVCTVAGALARLKHARFDVLIVDRAMVGLKGDELAARVKQNWPRLPIIMTTDFAMDFNASGTTFKNVDYVLGKTFALPELLGAIARVRPRERVRSRCPARSLSGRTHLN